MTEGFLDMCWDANDCDEEEESNGSSTDADEVQEPVIWMLGKC